MKSIVFLFLFSSYCFVQSQVNIDVPYIASAANPYGLVHPDSKDNLSDFAPMIGSCNCKSVNRNVDGTWQDTVDMIWNFKYIMNGQAIQDETWKADGKHSGSIRQFQQDSAQWVVTYFSQPGVTYTPGVWIGGQIDESIILKKDHKAPNGMEGVSKLIFSNISDDGFDWEGMWTTPDESIIWPFWRIYCTKIEN